MSWKKSALIRPQIFRLFINTLTTDDKYSRPNMQNFSQQLETPLSRKQKTFSEFFIAFLKCAWSLEHLRKKDENPMLIIYKIIDSEGGGYLNVQKVLLQNTIR